MRIALGTDHKGFRYKELIKQRLSSLGHEVRDFGTDSEAQVDYPEYVRPAAEAVGSKACDRGIVLGASGNGEAMVANRVRGVRCALCWNEETARLARAHNDSNVLSLGATFLSEDEVLRIVDVWMRTPFEGGRHKRRIEMIDVGTTRAGG
jgi:ribose 5-phosphate isomerase B